MEQSNKNCRILSFKLRKVERKSEELENERSALEKKYEEVNIKKTKKMLNSIKLILKEKNMYIYFIFVSCVLYIIIFTKDSERL